MCWFIILLLLLFLSYFRFLFSFIISQNNFLIWHRTSERNNQVIQLYIAGLANCFCRWSIFTISLRGICRSNILVILNLLFLSSNVLTFISVRLIVLIRVTYFDSTKHSFFICWYLIVLFLVFDNIKYIYSKIPKNY